jgi:hypothetical protein
VHLGLNETVSLFPLGFKCFFSSIQFTSLQTKRLNKVCLGLCWPGFGRPNSYAAGRQAAHVRVDKRTWAGRGSLIHIRYDTTLIYTYDTNVGPHFHLYDRNVGGLPAAHLTLNLIFVQPQIWVNIIHAVVVNQCLCVVARRGIFK